MQRPQNVHEGPIGIGTRPQYVEVSLAAGNVISNGEYKVLAYWNIVNYPEL